MKKNKYFIIALFLIGFGILIFPHVAERINTKVQHDMVDDFRDRTDKKEEEVIEEELEQLKSCYDTVYYDENGIHDPFEASNDKLLQFKACMGLEGDEVFATIDIPKLKLAIPIYLGSSNYILSQGVGHVEGSSLPIGGNSTHSVLSAHRGMGTKAMFRNIDELHEGDVFYIHGSTGTLKYVVTQQRVIYPDQTSSLNVEEDKDMVTLLTCHPYRYNYQRLLIHGERVEDNLIGK